MDRIRLSFRSTSLELHPGVQLRSPSEPAEHFFGYYDKSPWDTDARRLLYHRYRGGGEVELVVYDLENDAASVVDASPAWNWQQGSMLQWWPDSVDEVAYNTVEDGELVTVVQNVVSGRRVRRLPMPMQTARCDGGAMIGLNYRRLANTRADYAYTTEVANLSPDQPYEEDGLWRVDVEGQTAELIVTIRDLTQHLPVASMDGADHWVNHAMYAPVGRRLVFMHRWRNGVEKTDRLYTVNDDGTELWLLADDGMCSHYSWRDGETLLAYCRKMPWGEGYFLFRDRADPIEPLGRGVLEERGDGHPSYSPDGRWVVTDSYPDRNRMRHLIVYDTAARREHVVGRFFAPWAFDGPGRCDLHPRWSPDGRSVCIDSAHTGARAMSLIDVSSVAGKQVG